MSPRSVHPLETNMAGIAAFLKNAWNKEPVIVASCAIAVVVLNIVQSTAEVTKDICKCIRARQLKFEGNVALIGIALPYISPFTKYSAMINSATPYNYPVPVRDDGNMPDVPAHPCEPKGNNLEWLKNL